jgi:hypothetical protein
MLSILLCAGLVFSGCRSTPEIDKGPLTLTLDTVQVSHASTYSRMTVILAVSASNRLQEAQRHLSRGNIEHAVQNILSYNRMCREGLPRTLKLGSGEPDFTVICSVLSDALDSHKADLGQLAKSPFPAISAAAQTGITSADSLTDLIKTFTAQNDETK